MPPIRSERQRSRAPLPRASASAQGLALPSPTRPHHHPSHRAPPQPSSPAARTTASPLSASCARAPPLPRLCFRPPTASSSVGARPRARPTSSLARGLLLVASACDPAPARLLARATPPPSSLPCPVGRLTAPSLARLRLGPRSRDRVLLISAIPVVCPARRPVASPPATPRRRLALIPHCLCQPCAAVCIRKDSRHVCSTAGFVDDEYLYDDPGCLRASSTTTTHVRLRGFAKYHDDHRLPRSTTR